MSDASSAISRLNESINSFQGRVNTPIKNVYQSSVQVDSATTEIHEGILKFKQDMMHGEETQLAHENVIRIDQIIKEQFSNHENIRKTVMGIVRDFDINLVRNSTIQELSEEMWITSSRYWLSYALIAITAWVNDYPEVARNALAESGRRDAIKTTLFFCLMNLRFERMAPAKAWFCEYLKVLDPSMLHQETAVLLEAFLNGIFGRDKELEHSVLDLIDEWMRILNEDAESCEALVNEYVTYIHNLKNPVKYSGEAVTKFCANHDQIRRSYEEVSKYDTLLALVKELDVEMQEQNDENYKARVDSVLMSLISRYDEEELTLKNQQAYYRFVVENEGDTDKAEAQYEQLQQLQSESFNIGKQMMRWAIFDGNEETNPQVRKFGFQNTKKWFLDALVRWDTNLHQAKPVNFQLQIDAWSGVSNGADQAEQAESMKNYFEANKFHNMFINTPNMALALLVVLSAGMAFVTIFSLIVTLVAAGILGWRCFKAIKEYPKRVNMALANLDACMAEIAEFDRYYTEKRQQKELLINQVEFI